MSETRSVPVNKGKIWFNSFIMALAGSCGYLIVAIVGQHDPLVTVIATASIAVALTPIFYLLNVRRARLGNPPRRRI